MRRGFWLLMIMILGWSVWQSHTSTPFLWAAGGGDGTNERVSVGNGGTEANGASMLGGISPEGEWVAFISFASNLAPKDTHDGHDLFLHHRTEGTTIRITDMWDGSDGNNFIQEGPLLSANGRYVAFSTDAPDLVPNDTNHQVDCFVYDRTTDTIERISVTSGGQQRPSGCHLADMTPDGQYVTFTSTGRFDPNEPTGDDQDSDVFLRDRIAGTTTRITSMDTGSLWCSCTDGGAISDDGRWIAFDSSVQLVPAHTNREKNIYLYDRTEDTLRLISVNNEGEAGDDDSYLPVISRDGSTIAFTTLATNLAPNDVIGPDIFITDVETGALQWVTVGVAEERTQMGVHGLSFDGNYLFFTTNLNGLVPGDNGDETDAFMYEFDSDTTVFAAAAQDGSRLEEGSMGLGSSADGAQILFVSAAADVVTGDENNATDVFVRTLTALPLPTRTPTITPTATRTRLPVALFLPLTVKDTAVPTYPRTANLTQHGNGDSFAPVADANGTTVAFLSEATNLVPNDTNGVTDAFVWQQSTGQLRRISVASDGSQANGQTTHIALSEDGRYALFLTEAGNLVAGDNNGLADVYRHDLWTGSTEWVSVGLNGAAPDGLTTGADLSADGRWVVFSSQARNITTVPLPAICAEAPCETLYRRDMQTGKTETWLTTSEGVARTPLRNPSLSSDGQSVAFEQMTLTGYTNHCQEGCLYPDPVYDPFLYLYQSATDEVVELARSTFDEMGRPAEAREPMAYITRNRVLQPTVAGDVPLVLYRFSNSHATQYFSQFDYGITAKGVNGTPSIPAIYTISGESSYGAQPVRVAEEMPPASVRMQSISANGQHVAFAVADLRRYNPNSSNQMGATPEIPDDANNLLDIYRFSVETERYERISDAYDGSLSNGNSRDPFIAANGLVVLFASEASNLVAGDGNDMMDIFMWQTVR